MGKYLLLLSVLLLSSVSSCVYAKPLTNSKVDSSLTLSAQQNDLGHPVYIRIIKNEHKLELFVQRRYGYQKIKSYIICNYSGGLGPKKRQGDHKSPEGFYQVTLNSLNPNSRYYRAFNIGYPNQYDKAHGFTGNYLMVHGACVSIGCYAMTDAQIDEIYRYVEAALKNGQPQVGIDIFPFRLTEENLYRHRGSEHYDFWRQLKSGYDYFEQYHQPPNVSVVNGRYAVAPNLKQRYGSHTEIALLP